MKQKVATLATVANGWEMNTTTMGVYGTYYLKRAIVAALGLGANLPEDAIYPMLLADSTGSRWMRARRPQLYGPLTVPTGLECDTRRLKFEE